MLAGTRLRLLNGAEEKSEIRTMISRREQLRGEFDELVTKGRRWAQSAVKLRELADEVDKRQAEAKALAARARKLEVAINVKPLWVKRGKIDDQLERFANLRPLEDGTIESLEDLNKRVEDHQRQRDILKGQRQQLIGEAKKLGINDLLVRNGQRLEALLEQQDWLQAVERMTGELADEIASIESRLASENERLSHEWTGAGKIPPRITSEIVEQLMPQARAIEATEQMLASARAELEVHLSGEHDFRTQIELATAGGEKYGLPKDLEAATDLVAQLRRRQQVDERIEAAQREAEDLQQQAGELVDEQVIPIGIFSWLAVVFIASCVAIAAWWVVPASTFGKYGAWVGIAGIAGSIFALVFKQILEYSASSRFDDCHQQLDTLLKQIDDAQDEQARLDRELPLTEGSAALRLQYAEQHLAELERVLPVESQRREAAQAITSAERRAKLAEEKYAAATANWKARLRALGLPDDVSPENLATMAGQCERLAELEARLDNRREDKQRREREHGLVSQRIFNLAEETGLRSNVTGHPEAGSEKNAESGKRRAGSQTAAKVTALEQLDKLRAEYHKQQERVARRKELRERAKKLRAEQSQHFRSANSVRRRLETLFQKCGVADEQELRQLAAKLDEAEELRKKRDAATREIVAAIGKHGNEADFAPLLAPDQIGRIESDWETLSSQTEELDRGLKDALQRRGALVEQQRAAAADQSLAKMQVELDLVDEQIQRAIEAWRERAAVSMFLERIREDYEQHRQPETLREASKYMSQLTGGKYTRIWTPLAHDILFVDTAEGQPLSVQVLSRGTREQLFVSLRLALVAAYARRGIHLPMILDDVFVNFDAGRTRTACAVLRDFAKQGHQLLVFTCHEHVWRMFQELKVETRRIPNRHGEVKDVVETPQAEPAPEPVPKPAPEPVMVAPPPAPPEPEPPKPVQEKRRRKREVVRALEPVVEEVVVKESPAEPTLTEVEYWWDDAPHATNGSSDWLPEPVIHPERW
jgi:uncharacterized protein YhaN